MYFTTFPHFVPRYLMSCPFSTPHIRAICITREQYIFPSLTVCKVLPFYGLTKHFSQTYIFKFWVNAFPGSYHLCLRTFHWQSKCQHILQHVVHEECDGYIYIACSFAFHCPSFGSTFLPQIPAGKNITYICVPRHALCIFGAANMGDDLQRSVYPCVCMRHSVVTVISSLCVG